MNYFFTSDQHFGHTNILRYCNRPFNTVEEMDEEIISNFNSVVTSKDVTIHGGDLTLISDRELVYKKYITRLNGKHIFLIGSHDRWIHHGAMHMWIATIQKQPITVCHYAMRTWHRSHYNAWQLYGHSHGKLEPIGKQWDIGVDNNDFYPLSFEQLRCIMSSRPDNPNLIRRQ